MVRRRIGEPLARRLGGETARSLYPGLAALCVAIVGIAGLDYLPAGALDGAIWLFAATLAGVVLMLVSARPLRPVERPKLFSEQAENERLRDRIWQLEESLHHYRGLAEASAEHRVRADIATGALDAIGPTARLFRDTGDREAFLEAADSARAAGRLRFDLRHRDGGAACWIAWEVADRRRLGGMCDYHGRDVTARKTIEADLEAERRRAEEANAAKSRFLASMSHEIRTPMSGVIGMADLLMDSGLTPEQRTYANAIRSSGTALLELIDDILDFSRIEAGRIELDPQPFDLGGLVEELVELLAPRAHGKGLSIASHVDAALPPVLVGDAGRIRQILLNLAGNAVKFTETGGVVIEARRAGAGVEIAVRDSGPGIPADAVERIFEDFEQVDGSAARRHGGSGLGLAISRRLADAMGGTIACRSAPGEGSAFTFSVPLAIAEAPGGESPGLAASRPLAGHTVAIAGMEPLETAALAATLRDLGASVPKARRRPRDGVTTIASPEAFETTDGVRLVALTSAERGMIDRFRQEGAAGYLIRPIRRAALIARLGAARLAGDSGAERRKRARSRKPARESLRILIAEDSPVNAILARTLVERLGHEPVMAVNGREALLALKAGPAADLVLMDMRMPEMDGIDAVKAMRRTKSLRAIPVVALTANASHEDRAACIAAGMDGYLTKPVSRDDLERALERLVARKRSA
ncbi:MAG: ATP-binding protein [Flavobacteriaceae bacterium]